MGYTDERFFDSEQKRKKSSSSGGSRRSVLPSNALGSVSKVSSDKRVVQGLSKQQSALRNKLYLGILITVDDYTRSFSLSKPSGVAVRSFLRRLRDVGSAGSI